MGLWTVALLVFLVNLPFGYWRASVRRLSPQWFLALHLSVSLVVALSVYSGLAWKLISFPVLVGAFFLGQFVGGKVRHMIQGRGPGRHAH
jgi:hypothetical protein